VPSNSESQGPAHGVANRPDSSPANSEALSVEPLQKQPEEQLQVAELVDQVAELTAELEQLKPALQQAQQELLDRDVEVRHLAKLSSLGEMMARITHELRQPLNSISNFAFATANLLDKQQDQSLDKVGDWNLAIIQQVKRAEEILCHLRSYAQRSNARVEPLDINQIIECVLIMMQSELRTNQVKVRLELASGCPMLELARVPIEQVLINLIGNSCQAFHMTSRPEHTIEIKTSFQAPLVKVTIRDNGPGLPAGELMRVFEPFRTTRREGLGLGLTISRSIIEDHGGQIWAEQCDPGLAIQFTLPLQSQ